MYFLILLLYLSFHLYSVPEFDREEVDSLVKIGYGLATGDVDGDGLPDILLADKEQFVWYKNPGWERFIIADKLTERDNVCLAARDIDGDGKVELATGAMWNPGETSDESLSGSVHYLIRPTDPTRSWKPVRLHHEPTVHRMHWIRTGTTYQLVVLPLHGRGNENGTGKGVKILAYEIPDNPADDPWKLSLLDSSLHMTHNFDVISEDGREALLVGGKEGTIIIRYNNGNWKKAEWLYDDSGFGEVRVGNGFLSGIQPMHGNVLAVYTGTGKRIVLSSSLNQGHALAVADLLSLGNEQVVAGWREKNNGDEMGIKLFIPSGDDWTGWEERWIDRNGMACEDLKLADLDQDGKMDVIASGRSTHNLVIYWNRN